METKSLVSRRFSHARRAVTTALAAVLATAGLVTVVAVAAPAAGGPLNVLSTDRVDVSTTGSQLSGGACNYSYYGCGGSVSGDGRQVSFVTPDAADPSDSNGNWDAYVTDVPSGRVARVSLADDGGDAWALDAQLSGSGRYVAFNGCCSLVPGETSSSHQQIYVRDRDTDGNGIFDEPGGTATRLMSKPAVPGQTARNVDASYYALSPDISSDGRFVSFIALSDNLPGGDLGHYYGYIHDRDTDGNGIFDEPGKELTELVTVGTDNTPVLDLNGYGCGWYGYGGSNCGVHVSDDGLSISFTTSQSLDPADVNGAYDTYVRRRGHHDTMLLSTNGAGDPIDSGAFDVSMSASGRFAALSSYGSNLPGYNGNWQVYLRDRDANANGTLDEPGDATVELVSTGPDAAGGNSTSYMPSVSDDGTVAFVSYATNLDPSYTNPLGRVDAYVRLRDGTIKLASPTSDAAPRTGVLSVQIASNALVVSFTSDYSDLVPDDTNNTWDLFRAELGNAASAISVSVSSSASTSLPGATSVAINDIPTETRKAFGLDVSTAPSGTRLRPSGTRLRPSGTRLRPSGTRLRPSGTRLRDVGDVTFASVAARLAQATTAREAPLSQLEVTTPGGWPDLLAGTVYADVPIQSVTIGDLLDLLVAGPAPGSPLAGLRLGDLNINDSPLAAITPAGFELGSAPVRSLIAQNSAPWCDAFASATGKTCEVVGIPADSGRSLMELDLDPNTSLMLAEHPELRRPALGPNLVVLQASGAPIVGARLDDMNLGVTRIGDLGLSGAVAEPSSGVGAVSLDSLTSSERALVATCTTPSFSCTGKTLADALAAGALNPGRTLADAGRHYGSVTVGQLGSSLLGDIEVNDVVTGFLDAADFPWEDLDLATAGVQDYSDDVHTLDENLSIRIASDSSNPVTGDAQMQLPAGFRLDPRVRGGMAPVVLDGPAGASAQLVTKHYDENATTLRWSITDLTPNADYMLHVRVLPSLRLGSGQVTARLWAGGRSGFATPTGVQVVEPADPGATAATAGTVTSDRLSFGYLPGGGDVDLYSFNPRTSDSEVGVRLSHLAGDADLVLYGPPTDSINVGPSSAATRTVAPQVAPIDDEGLDPTSNQVAARPEVSSDVPVNPPTGATVVGRSATSGDVEEEIASGTGASFVQVSTYNGSTSPMPYVLHVHEISPTPVQVCQPYSHPFTGLPGSLPNLATLPSDLATVILVDRARLGDQYPAADVAALIAKLQTLASDPTVKGVVLPVEGSNPALSGLSQYPDIAGAYAQLVADACDPKAANRVVDRITQLVQGIRAGTLPGVSPHTQLANVVVVGSDSVIPMARVTDTTRAGNESQYADAFDDGTPIGAALASDHFLTDAPFGDLDPIQWLNRRLYVEDLAVGRLVESPQEMTAVVDGYLAPGNGKSLDPTKAFVAGYDWMKTGAQSVTNTLATRLTQANGGQTVTPGSLITDSWSSTNLLTGAGSIGAAQSKITGLYMHADHGTGVAANGEFFAPSQLASALPTGSKLVFSMGCHSGIADPNLAGDFPGTLNGVGASYLASTGFGYGDDTGVQLHDRLVNFFADQLNGSTTIGEALTRAKQQYFSTQGLYGAYDDKVLETMTLYGLPMFRIGTGNTVPTVPPDVTPTAGTGGVSRASFAYDTTAPGAVDVPMQGTLDQHIGTNGRWYEVNGSLPLALPGRPVQPRVDHDVTARSAGSLFPAHGALITGLSEPALPIANFDAAWSRATIDSAGNEPELVAGDVAFPARLATVSTFSDPSGAPLSPSGPPQRQRLIVTPGRFESSGLRDAAGTGTQDLFSRVDGQLLYSGSADFTEPAIRDSFATVDPFANTANFSVDASDTSGVSRVLILFRDDTGWKHLDLDAVSGTHWEKATPVVSSANSVPYFVQVVDGNGNIGVASNKGALFDAGVRPSVSINDVTVGEPLNGKAPATFTVTLSKVTSVPVMVDWSTVNGTASSLGDYASASGSLVFAPNETSKTVSIDVFADTENEPDETFTVELANVNGAAIATGTGTATISGPGTVPVFASAQPPAQATVGAAYTYAFDATGSPSSTFTVASGLLPGGLTLSPNGLLSGTPSQSGTFIFSVAATNSVGSTTAGPFTITVFQSPRSVKPGVGVGDVSVVRPDSGSTVVDVPVVLSWPSAASVSVNFATVNGTAIAGTAYTAASGTLTFAPGQTVATVPVTVAGDAEPGANQLFLVKLSAPLGVVIGDGAAKVTIVNPHGPMSVGVANAFVLAGPAASLAFVVSLSSPVAAGHTVTVNFATKNGTAIAATDYTAASGTVTFTAGQQSQTVNVSVLDTTVAKAKTLTLVLSTAVGAALADPAATGTITNT